MGLENVTKYMCLGIAWTKYPWLCGYGISPFLLYYGMIDGRFTSEKFGPQSILTFGGESIDANIYKILLGTSYSLHFIRRALEVAFLQTYTSGTEIKRDSIIELLYYACWAYINGVALSQPVLDKAKLPSTMQVGIGLAVFASGQVGNAYCHYSLEMQKRENSPNRFIPKGLFFDSIVAPHYTFEILSWVGFTCASGGNLPAATILSLSLFMLWSWSTMKKESLLKLEKKKEDGKSSQVASRWCYLPLVW
eukprot:gnl/MRDRNA2_/MRDRNA2_100974_c0_seq1.p1 gnl/MRDRNA2_/MRDRNA2_100974_c0~~gnl/MRDRNA2_/MRDRNA2_100974_c0_seq1.p1  ORF type:complete len:250 (+),score=4.09 gnl/MRDRNA2_/MRDRNA2_100974_c0_seq1:169-918(+)